MINRGEEVAETARLVRRASELGKDDAVALNMAGTALAYVVGNLDHGTALIEQALLLNSNLATAWHQSGWMSIYRGDPEGALERFIALCDLARATLISLTCRLAPDAHSFSTVDTLRLCHGPKQQYGTSRTPVLHCVRWRQAVRWPVGRSKRKRRSPT